MPAGLRSAADVRIADHVRELACYTGARQLLLYLALPDEVSLSALIDRALADHKLLYLPCVDADGALVYRAWSPGDRLVRSGAGVEEPAAGEAPAARPSIILVPGRAFDGAGGRVGRGMGCFDRSLVGLAALGPTVGVAYSCQLEPEVPREPHDVTVDLVVTEQGVAGALGA